MKSFFITVLVLVIIGFGAYAIMHKPSAMPPAPAPTPESAIPSPAATPAPTPPQHALPSSVPSSVTVNIQNFSYAPSTLTVKPGTTVTWINNDTVPHTVTSNSGSMLKSPTLSPGQSFSFTFPTIGSFAYHCAFHSMMKGMVVVQQ